MTYWKRESYYRKFIYNITKNLPHALGRQIASSIYMQYREQVASSPGHSHVFNVWEWPGDEARKQNS
jgi:hypothetical protein